MGLVISIGHYQTLFLVLVSAILKDVTNIVRFYDNHGY